MQKDYPKSEVKSLDEIIKKMNSASVDVISFDIFDTLLVRTIGSPSDFFELLDKYFKELDPSVISFGKIREEAEGILRRQIIAKDIEKEDITLDEIYEVMIHSLGVPSDIAIKMKDKEISLEKRVCKCRKSGKYLFDEAIKTGKRVILISDMYLCEATIKEILSGLGYEGYDKLYLSSTIGLRKTTGHLYQYVISDLQLKPDTVLHIGDNYESDDMIAGKKGFRTIWFPSTRYMYESKGCGNQVKKICADLTDWEKAENSIGIGIMRQLAANKYFDDPFRQFEDSSDYNADAYFVGYGALGMELFALSKWIGECGIADGVDKIIFMARDGYLPMKAYEILSKYDKLPAASYLPVSRLAVLPAMIHTPLDLYDMPMDLHYQTPRKLMDKLSFCMRNIEDNELDLLLETNGFCDKDQIFTPDRYIDFIRFFIDHMYDETKHAMSKNRIKNYMLSENGGKIDDNSALFDMGYSGRIPEAIIHATGLVPSIYYFHADSREHFRYEKVSGMKIKTFFDFNPYMEASMREYSYLEVAPSCVGYDEELKPIFDIGPAMGYKENALKMQKGALDFISDYLEDYGEFKEEAGFRYHEAAMPFEAFIRYCSYYDRAIYDNVLMDDELWGGRRDIDLKELMEIRLQKIPEYAKEK